MSSETCAQCGVDVTNGGLVRLCGRCTTALRDSLPPCSAGGCFAFMEPAERMEARIKCASQVNSCTAFRDWFGAHMMDVRAAVPSGGGALKEALLCSRCRNIGTVPCEGEWSNGLPARELCPTCMEQGRIKYVGNRCYTVVDGINREMVLACVEELHREDVPPVEMDYRLAAGSDDE